MMLATVVLARTRRAVKISGSSAFPLSIYAAEHCSLAEKMLLPDHVRQLFRTYFVRKRSFVHFSAAFLRAPRRRREKRGMSKLIPRFAFRS
jgi:hypothetical protein